MSSKLTELNKKLFESRPISEEAVKLPSNGAIATIRPMKVKEQKSILKALDKKTNNEYLINQAFDELLENCVLTVDGEPFDNDTLLIQDRTFLLIQIRRLTTGDEAKIAHVDPETNKVVNDIEINLKELPVEYFDGKLTKRIKIVDDIEFELKALTRKDEKEIDRWTKKNKGSDSIIDKRYCAYAALIKDVYVKNENSEFEKYDLDFDEKVQLIVKSLTHKDLELFDEFLRSLDFGIKLRFHYKSPYSDYENEEEEAHLISFFIL